jgi:GTP-binding protein Era
MEKKSGVVAIAGRPNSGKSSLLNRVLGSELSIVTPKAQTTREQVRGILNDEVKGQIVFVDTPGIHRARDGGINEVMVNEARDALEAPDLIWYLLDPHSAIEHEEPVLDLLEKSRAPVFLIGTKSDLKYAPGETRTEEVEKACVARGIKLLKKFRVSAHRNRGLTELLDATWEHVPPGPILYPDLDALSDRPLRFFAAEKIREQLYLKLGEEIPYSCAVQIEKYSDEPHLTRIEALIHVERESQKPMVIGKGGHKIKEIGAAARKELEKLVGRKVFLGLNVKVWANWTRDREALRRMGINVPPREGERT